MVQFALFAVLGLSSQAQQPDVNVWFCPNVEVTDHSAFDRTPAGRYDARDVFGADYGSVAGEHGHIVFEDDSGGAGQPDFIEWNTKSPVEIDRLVFAWQDDSPGRDWRNLARFRILARQTTGDNWQVLWQENTPSRVGRYKMEKKIPATQCQGFRAEFIRNGATNSTAVAPRICELEAYGHVVNP